jgi:hypothetical protein
MKALGKDRAKDTDIVMAGGWRSVKVTPRETARGDQKYAAGGENAGERSMGHNRNSKKGKSSLAWERSRMSVESRYKEGTLVNFVLYYYWPNEFEQIA